jgi:hypothetical protein
MTGPCLCRRFYRSGLAVVTLSSGLFPNPVDAQRVDSAPHELRRTRNEAWDSYTPNRLRNQRADGPRLPRLLSVRRPNIHETLQ